jgi:hypothetical protein
MKGRSAKKSSFDDTELFIVRLLVKLVVRLVVKLAVTLINRFKAIP